MLNNRNDVLVPKYTASASLTGVVNGELVIAPADTSLSVALIPFMRGDTGAQGEQGIQGVKGDKGDKGDTGQDGITELFIDGGTFYSSPKEYIAKIDGGGF